MVTNKALKYIEDNKDNPFFLFVSFNIPHYPEQPDKKYANAFNHLKHPRREYARMMATVDDHVGLIMKKVEDLKLKENTIVLFYSDNGHSTEEPKVWAENHASGFPKGYYYGAFGGGGYTGKWIGQKGSFLEGGIRVPAILSYPAKLKKGIVRDQAVIGADWYPTLLELCGIELPKVKLDGRSVLPLIKDAKKASPHNVMYWGWQNRGIVREGKWKLYVFNNKPAGLFNLSGPNPEKVNYLGRERIIQTRLFNLYQDWMKETKMK